MILLFFAIILNSHGYELIGRANDLKTGKPLYIEKHAVTEDKDGFSKIIKTDYQDTSGKTFARIVSDFSKDKFTPDAVFEDDRFNTIEEQTYDVAQKKVTIVHKNKITKKETKKSFDHKPNMLAGQGFNNFIVAHFDKLKNGEIMPVNFVVIAKKDFFKFDIRKKVKMRHLLDLG